MSSRKPIMCPYCRSRHMPKFLCDAAAQILEALAAKVREHDMPTLTFDEPIMTDTLGTEPGDVHLLALTVMAAAVEGAAGVYHPALVMSGRSADGKPLQRWVYAGSDEMLLRVAGLFAQMTELAISRSDEINSMS